MATDDDPGTAPLYGFLAPGADGGGILRIEVVDGVWEVPDGATVREWAQPTWQGTGRAVEVLVSAGTEVRFTKAFTVGSLDTPLTLTDSIIEMVGADKVDDLGKSWRVRALAEDEVAVEDMGTSSWEYTWRDGEDTPYDGRAIDCLD